MVEFTLIFPVLAILLFGVIQFGIAFNNYLAVTDAVRAGSRQAAVARFLPASQRVPTVESISMLSILHHIAQLFDDPSRYRAFLGSMLDKATRLVILELASPDEGRFAWSEPNRVLYDGQSAVAWHSDFLQSHGFSVEADPVYFPTHLGGTRPILIARRRSS